MADFINTIDVLGDDAVIDSIIDRSITEFKDNKLVEVGEHAFYNCTNLKTVHLSQCTYVHSGGFNNCSSLEVLDMPALTDEYGTAFNGLTSLKVCNMPELLEIDQECFMKSFTADAIPRFPKVTRVHARAFRDTPVRIIDLPACTTLSGYAFYICTSLIALILRNTETVCTTDVANPFQGNWSGANGPISKGEGYIYVPRALVDSYKAATNWSNFASQFRALEDYTVDGTTTGALDESKI